MSHACGTYIYVYIYKHTYTKRKFFSIVTTRVTGLHAFVIKTNKTTTKKQKKTQKKTKQKNKQTKKPKTFRKMEGN